MTELTEDQHMRRRVVCAAIIALLCCSCEPQVGEELWRKAERYACTKDEQVLMGKYFTVCMTGSSGYFSSYCLDRATVASCHERSDGAGGGP